MKYSGDGQIKVFIGILLIVVVLCASGVMAIKEREEKNVWEAKEFSVEELYLSGQQVALAEAVDQLHNKTAWESFMKRNESAYVYVDPRSGRAASLMYAWPFILGTGEGNNITLEM